MAGAVGLTSQGVAACSTECFTIPMSELMEYYGAQPLEKLPAVMDGHIQD